MNWLINSLLHEGIEVKPHSNFKSNGIERLEKYNPEKDNDVDICIYNHTDESMIIGDVLKAKQNWFFKPTVPDEVHVTLDILGYGPYSSITYKKPTFEDAAFKYQIREFFNNKVKNWVDSKISKWGDKLSQVQEIPEDNYYLVLGQCGGDSVVTHFDFGHYFTKLEHIVKELVRVGDRQIIVKLHPYTDGEEGTAGSFKNFEFSLKLQKTLESISPKVKVYIGKISVHNFIQKAYCVFLANSGAGFEVMMHHKPLIVWGLPEYHWTSYDLRHLADIRNAIKLEWFNKDKQDRFLYWYMEKYCFYNQKTCDRRVKELLEDMKYK
jgi:hypothetical protein